MRADKIIIFGAAAALLAAIALSPANDAVADEATALPGRLVRADLEHTWNVLTTKLARRPFVINNLRRDSNNIRVLFHSNTPSDFVDCGRIAFRTKDDMFGERSHNFPAANSSRYLVEVEGSNRLVDVERKTSLNGLANIQLVSAPEGTLIHVNARYVMIFKLREYGGNLEPYIDEETLTFSTTEKVSRQEQLRDGATRTTVSFECRANGELERRIVSLLGSLSS